MTKNRHIGNDQGVVLYTISDFSSTRKYPFSEQLKVSTPEPQPKININIQVDVLAYQQFGLQSKLGKQFTNHKGRLLQPPKVSMVTDTGVQVDCLSKDKRRCLGLNESSFLKTELSLGCANESDAG